MVANISLQRRQLENQSLECLVASEVVTRDDDSRNHLDNVDKRIRSEMTEEGDFRRQGNRFPKRFGYGLGDVPVLPNRYRIIGLLGCGWNRRQRIVLRLLGLDTVIGIESVIGRRRDTGWILNPEGLGKQFGYKYLLDFYKATDSAFAGRATSPAVVDERTGKVVTNEYNTLSIDFETVWKPYHEENAPELYPDFLRSQINLLNQQLFDDINNGTYKVIFATNQNVAEAALRIYEARLFEINERLRTRRYLFGPYLTDSDIRLFQTLEAYEVVYRPRVIQKVKHDVKHLWDFPNLWAYARELFNTDEFVDDEELRALGFKPFDDGSYALGAGYQTSKNLKPEEGPIDREEYWARWSEPSDRSDLTGSWEYSGPGTGGFDKLWKFGDI